MVKRRLTLDVSKPGSQQAIYARQGDARIYELHITLVERSATIRVPLEWRAVLRMLKPDGTKIFNTAKLEDGRICVYLETQALAASGVAACEVDVYGVNGETLFSPRFDVFIEPNVLSDDEIESTDEFSALTDAMGSLTTLEAEVEKAEEQREEAQAARNRAIDGMTGEAYSLPPDDQAHMEVTDKDGHKHLVLGVPRGKPGVVTSLDSGLFGMFVDENGHLIVAHNDDEPTPPLEIRDGHLVYIIKE